MPGRTKLQIQADRQAADTQRAIARELADRATDSGLTAAAIARVAGLSRTTGARYLSGDRPASPDAQERIAAVLGGRITARVRVGAGPATRDRFQVPMAEGMLRELGPVWRPHPEVTVEVPARGSIDLVLETVDVGPLLVAAEFQSEIRRLEQTLRWSAEKAAGLRSTPLARAVAARTGSPPEVSRLLVLRSTASTRAIAADFSAALAAAYPASTVEAVAALRGLAPWPGSAVVWMAVEGSSAALLRGLPRGLRD